LRFLRSSSAFVANSAAIIAEDELQSIAPPYSGDLNRVNNFH